MEQSIITLDNCDIRHSSQLISMITTISKAELITERLGDTLKAIAYNWNKQALTFPSQITIAKRIGVKNTRTVRTHIKKASELKLLSYHQPRKESGLSRSNHYLFNLELISTLYQKALTVLGLKKQKDAQPHDDPPPLDPPITSSLRSEEKNNIYITEDCSSCEEVFYEAIQEDIEFSPEEIPPVQVMEAVALFDEYQHHQKLKYNAVVNKGKRKRNEWMKAWKLKQDEQKAADNQKAQAQQKRIEQFNSEAYALEVALLNWSSMKKGFTKTMFERLEQINKLVARSGIIQHWMKKYREVLV